MDDDPFAVVAPSEKKMSTYLKKSKDSSSASRCVETSSHGTNSTRSTTNSTYPSEDSNLFSSKGASKKSANNSGFNNSGSSGSANFDFGNGLEFGQGFGGSGIGDGGFAMSGSGGASDRQSKSSRNFSSAPDPFDASAAPEYMRSSSSGNDFDAFGGSESKAPKSMRNLSSGNDFDAFGSSEPKAPRSMRNLSAGNDFDAFSSSDPKAPKSMRNLSAGNDFDAFGSSEPKAPRSMRSLSSNNDFDAFGFSGSFQGADGGFPAFEREEDIEFGGGGFEATFDAFGAAEGNDGWEKRENWKHSRKSRSGDVPKRQHSSGQRRRSGIPRRAHSSDDGRLLSPNDGPSPRGSSRKSSGGWSPQVPHKSREKSPRRLDTSDHSPVTRTRSGRRATMDHSGHVENSGDKSQSSSDPRRRLRRGSVGYTSSDGSMDPATLSKIPPARSKSSAGPAHRPGGGRKQKRASITHTSSGSLDFMQTNRKEDDGESKDAEFDHDERAKSQEKIMEMYRGGGGLSSRNENKSDSCLGDINKHLDMVGLADEQSQASGDTGNSSRSRVRRAGRKKDKEKEDDSYTEPKDRKDRSKGSLLDRVADDSIHDTSSKSGHDGGGLSYSDRIMMAQHRSKRN